MPQGVSYVQISGIGAYIRIQMPIRAPAGLPCTIEAIIRSGTDTPSSRPTGPFSPNVGEEKFCELRLLGILRSWGAVLSPARGIHLPRARPSWLRTRPSQLRSRPAELPALASAALGQALAFVPP